MQPFVVDECHPSALFQLGIDIVDVCDEFRIASDDVDLADGYAHIVEDESRLVHIELSDFPFQRFFTPYVVFEVVCQYAHKGCRGRLKFQLAEIG